MSTGKFNEKEVIPADELFEASTIKNIRLQNRMNENTYLVAYVSGWFIQSLKGTYAPGFAINSARVCIVSPGRETKILSCKK